ncbi:MAG: hypothetical protein JXB85_05355 [Anaerolineales bacterium]|nr:hypothetical protein [Anaerolineales bacterium]
MTPLRSSTARNWLLLVSLLIPMAFFVLVTYIVPRPYYYHWPDVEQGTYYMARLLFIGQPADMVLHPGIPIQYLTKYIFFFSGTGFSHTQTFFNIGYFLTAVFTGLSFSFFSKKVLEKLPAGAAILALMICFANPSVLAFASTFGDDSFMLPFTIATATVLWMAFKHSDFKKIALYFFITGLGLGLTLAVKLSSLPLAIAINLAAWVQITVLPLQAGKKVASYFILPAATGLSFLLSTAPIINRYPELFRLLINRKDILPSLENSLRGLRSLFGNPSLWPLLLVGIGIVGTFLFFSIRDTALNLRAVQGSQKEREKFLQAVFLALLLAFLVYSFAAIEPSGEPGLLLRNLLPESIFFPFAIAYIFPFFTKTPPNSRALQSGLVLTGSILLCASAAGYLLFRENYIRRETALATANEEYFSQYAPDGLRVAIWDGSPGNLIGEEAFHFYGNYLYAHDAFDQELLAEYPHYTFFKMREVPRIIAASSAAGQPGPDVPDGLLGVWQSIFPPYWNPRSDEIVTGEASQITIRLIAFPTSELYELERRDQDLEALVVLVTERFGKVTVQEVAIQGVPWTLILIDEPGEP